MENKPVACPVCGGSEYYKESGFYFCSECQTQSQELHEHVHEYSTAGTLGSRTKVIKKSSNTEKEKTYETDDEWTSWEYYNFILKGLVDELIALGANRSLKIVVLQLWATYLKKLDVAFTSVTQTRLPKLGINYHPRDAKLVYGCDIEERKRSKRRACKRHFSEMAVATSSASFNDLDFQLAKLRLRRTKKVLFEEDYDRHAESSKDEMSEFNESMRSLDSSKGQVTSGNATRQKFPRLEFSYSARQLRSELYKKCSSTYYKADCSKRISSCKVLKSTNPSILSRIKLLAILYIALRIIQENIQLSDILRWVEEGELSFYEITHFFPEDVKLRGHDLTTFGPSNKKPSYAGISATAKELAVYLQATDIPVPDLLSLAKRYIEELQLPAEIGKYVECLMAMLPTSMEFNSSLKHFPNYEGRAMAFIIFVLKLLLGLDGKTEYEISKVAKKLNGYSGRYAVVVRLFVWEDWVQYIECRKSVLERFHFPTQAAHHRETFNNPGSFMRFWERMKSKDDKKHDRLRFSKLSKMNPEFVSAMKHVFLELLDDDADVDNTLDFVPSLTPQKENLKVIFASQSSVLQHSATEMPSSADILKQDFTKTTMKHLINPQQYVAMARKKGIKIIIQQRSAQNHVKQVHKMKRKFEYSHERLYAVVDTANEVSCSNSRKKKMKKGTKKKRELMNEVSSEKHNAGNLADELLQCSGTFGHLPLVAERMLLKHLESSGVLMGSNDYGADVSCVDSSTASGSSDENTNPSRAPKNKDRLPGHLEGSDISSKLGDQHKSKQVDQPSDIKKVLLKYLEERNVKITGMDESKEFVLYLPYVEYWLNEVNTKSQTFDNFEREVTVQFPPSFRWLITECARMLQMTIQDLYYELLDVELMYCYLHGL